MITSPFPGMDPYLESPDIRWDVHTSLMCSFAEQLAPQVRPTYFVDMKTRTVLDRVSDRVEDYIPEVVATDRSSMQTAAPTPIRMTVPLSCKVRLPALYIRRAKDKKVATAIELLSAITKRPGVERRKYIKRRESYVEAGVHFVEIDLLRSYPRMPFDGELPACDYVAMSYNADEGLACNVWPITVRHLLPVVPVPLLHPEPPVALDLQEAINFVYARDRYDLRIDYSQPAEPPLSDEDVIWAAKFIARQRQEKY